MQYMVCACGKEWHDLQCNGPDQSYTCVTCHSHLIWCASVNNRVQACPLSDVPHTSHPLTHDAPLPTMQYVLPHVDAPAIAVPPACSCPLLHRPLELAPCLSNCLILSITVLPIRSVILSRTCSLGHHAFPAYWALTLFPKQSLFSRSAWCVYPHDSPYPVSFSPRLGLTDRAFLQHNRSLSYPPSETLFMHGSLPDNVSPIAPSLIVALALSGSCLYWHGLSLLHSPHMHSPALLIPASFTVSPIGPSASINFRPAQLSPISHSSFPPSTPCK